jgi:hypothetical protein
MYWTRQENVPPSFNSWGRHRVHRLRYNAEHRGLKVRAPPWYSSLLAQISWRRRMEEHGIYCDGSSKALAGPTAWAEMLSCKLLSIAAAFVLYMMWWKLSMPSHTRALFRTLWYGVPNNIARHLDFFYISF